MSWLGWLKPSVQSSKSPLPVEDQVLSAVMASLSSPARALMEAQVGEVNLVQRLADGKEVNMYVKRGGKVRRNSAYQFPNRSSDLKLATVKLRLPDARKTLKADVFAVDGFVFEILFSESPRTVKPPVTIADVTIHVDPMIPDAGPAERQVMSARFDGWLGTLDERFGIEKAYVPLDAEARTRRLADIDAALPGDYLELIGKTDGLDLGHCTVFGLNDVSENAGDDGTYYMIGEIGGRGQLAVRAGARDGAVFFLGYDRERMRYPTLAAALDALCGAPLSEGRR